MSTQTFTYQDVFNKYTELVATVNTLPYNSIEQVNMLNTIQYLKSLLNGGLQQQPQQPQQQTQQLSYGDMFPATTNTPNNVQQKNLNFGGSNFSGHKMSGVSGATSKTIKPNIGGSQQTYNNNNNNNVSPTETLSFEIPEQIQQHIQYPQQTKQTQTQQLKQKFPYLLDPLNNEINVGNEREVVGPHNIIEINTNFIDKMPILNPLIEILKITNSQNSLKENATIVECIDEIILPKSFCFNGQLCVVKEFNENIEYFPDEIHSYIFNKIVKRFNGVLRAMENFDAAANIKSLKDIFKFTTSPTDITKNIIRYKNVLEGTTLKSYDEDNICITSKFAHVYYHTDFKIQGSHILFLSLESHGTLFTLLKSAGKDYGILEGLDYCFNWYKGLDKFLLIKKS